MCAHWLPNNNTRNAADAGSCSSPKIIYGYDNKGSVPTPDSARIENDEGWGMITGPDFGCIHASALLHHASG
jgi:hypothetical protein